MINSATPRGPRELRWLDGNFAREAQRLILLSIIQSSRAITVDAPVAIPSAKETISPSLMSAPADDQANARTQLPKGGSS
jgi:hypothetical protein